MKSTAVFVLVSALLLAGAAVVVQAHCEIPCGIYDDAMRVKMIREDIDTIEKSMNEIMRLQKEQPPNWNQLVRWVMNKEKHADKIQEVVSQYFMTQRIKPGMKNYQALLAQLHEMLVYSMKCKQTLDTANVDKLKSLVGDFENMYFAKE